MRKIADQVETYVGVDIVPDLIARNNELFATYKVTFQVADIAADPLPKSDLILCRDCFIHLPTRLVFKALNNFRASGSKYLLLTNCTNVKTYHDIPIGSFRPINFLIEPFSFPAPLASITESLHDDRTLCLWDLSSLPL